MSLPARALVLGFVALMPALAVLPARADNDRHANAHGMAAPHARPGEWYDNRWGHSHYYPAPGRSVPVLPGGAHLEVIGGSRYWYSGGVWYGPGPRGYVVVSPPFGVYVDVLPAFATAVVLGGITYYYANDVYYQPAPTGGYQVVAPPAQGEVSAAPQQLYVYPRQGQGAQQQAKDEYECHQWAVSKTGFDPTVAASGGDAGTPSQRADYARADTACLEGRGYTVR